MCPHISPDGLYSHYIENPTILLLLNPVVLMMVLALDSLDQVCVVCSPDPWNDPNHEPKLRPVRILQGLLSNRTEGEKVLH